MAKGSEEVKIKRLIEEPGVVFLALLLSIIIPKIGLASQEFMDVVLVPFSTPFFIFWFVRKMRKGKRIGQKKKLPVTVASSFAIFMLRHLPKTFEKFLTSVWMFVLATIIFILVALIFYLIQSSIYKFTEIDMRARLLTALLVTTLVAVGVFKFFSLFDIFGVI